MGATGRSVLVLCACWCALAFSGAVGEYRHHRQCSHLRHEFVHQNLGDKELIYDSPTHDPAVSICYDGSKEPRRATCCSAGAEAKYLEAAEVYFKTSIRQSFSELKNISNDLSSYEGQLVQLILEARNRTWLELASMHKVPAREQHDAVASLFLDLEQYVRRRGDVSLEDAVNQFFSALFPPVYSFVLSDPTLISYPQEFLNCLQQNQEDIAPFGNVPRHLKHRLTQTLSRSVAYLNSLAVVAEALNQSQSAQAVDPQCLRAVARMRFCGRCHLHLESTVCHGFCLNVLRGCLADVSEVSPEWDELVVTLEALGRTLQAKFSAEDLLAHLDKDISDAILQAMDDGRRISTKVKKKCGEEHRKGDPNYRPPETQSLTPRPLTSRPLAEQVGAVLKRLRDARGLYNRLADGICRDASLFQQDMRSDQCWNGTAVAQYMRDVPEANVISQARFNQELSVTVKPNYRLLQVREKLTHARKNLTELLSKGQQMLGDRPSQPAYSGDSMRPIVFNEVDDEDLYNANSGYGSGYGSGDTSSRTPPSSGNNDGKDRGPMSPARPPPGRDSGAACVRTVWLLLLAAAMTALGHSFLRV